MQNTAKSTWHLLWPGWAYKWEMWIRSSSRSGNARSEDPEDVTSSAPNSFSFSFYQLMAVCVLFTGTGHRCGFLCVCSSAALRVPVPSTSELVCINTWDETHICSVVKLLPLMLWVWVKVFLFLLTLCLFFLLFSDKWNQAKTLVFQNKYPDRMPDKLHMVCIIDLFAWELAKKNCWSQGSPPTP